VAYSPYGRILFQQKADLAGAGATSSSVIDIHDSTDLWLAAFIVGTPAGTTPTLNVQLDILDAFGNVFSNVLALTQLTGSTKSAQGSLGVHVNGTGSLVLPSSCQITWTLGGTTPKFPATCITLIGR
jgi:hypothetical protein